MWVDFDLVRLKNYENDFNRLFFRSKNVKIRKMTNFRLKTSPF